MLSDFLTPIAINSSYDATQIGSSIDRFQNDFPDLEGKQLAIVGVLDGRHTDNKETIHAPDKTREALYQLSINPQIIDKLVDLGNISAGASFNDTEVALIELVKELNAKEIVTMVLGGTERLSYALYQALEGVTNNLDLTYVAPRLPILEGQTLAQICEHKPNYLFNINALAFQSHYVPFQSLDVMNKLGFNQLRLGQMKSQPTEAEPLIRNTDLFIFDMGAVKQADAPANFNNNPNGLEGDMACKLCWYAGVSDLTRAMGIFEMNPEYDNRGQTAKLTAQMLWYFMDGFNNRVNDHPEQHQEFYRYRCNFDNKQPDIVFHKSKRTSRWWMEIPNPKSVNNAEMNVIVPCSYGDYQIAAKGELPDRYLRTLQKMH